MKTLVSWGPTQKLGLEGRGVGLIFSEKKQWGKGVYRPKFKHVYTENKKI